LSQAGRSFLGDGGVGVAATAPTAGGATPAAQTNEEENVEEKEESDDEFVVLQFWLHVFSYQSNITKLFCSEL
jgi:hypothetical protein